MTLSRRSRRFARLLAVVSAITATACQNPGPAEPDEQDDPSGMASLAIRADVSGTSVEVLTVEVTAADIPEPFVFNIPVVNKIGSGKITIPTGSDRTLTVRAFEAKGIETHRGETTIDVHDGENPTVSITLLPLEGIVPIELKIGGLIVTVDPAEATLEQEDELQLTAEVTDAEGNTVHRRVVWGSSNPSIATVSDEGLVTPGAVGHVEIVAQVGTARASVEIQVIRPFYPECVSSTAQVWDLSLAQALIDLALYANNAPPEPGTAMGDTRCWEVVEFIETPSEDQTADTQLYVGRNPQTGDLVVSFRGTENTEDWMNNLDAIPTDWRDGPATYSQVHRGFLLAYQSVQDRLRKVLAEQVKSIDDRPSARVYFTGHSLGGALATLAALDLGTDFVEDFGFNRNNVVMYSFGSPRSFTPGTSASYESVVPNSYAIAHLDDPVPHAVPGALPSVIPDIPQLPELEYTHVPNVVVLNSFRVEDDEAGVFQTRVDIGDGAAFQFCAALVNILIEHKNHTDEGNLARTHDGSLYRKRLAEAPGGVAPGASLRVNALGLMEPQSGAVGVSGPCDWVGVFRGEPTHHTQVLGFNWRWVHPAGISPPVSTLFKGFDYWAAYVDGFGNIRSTALYVPRAPTMSISRWGVAFNNNIRVNWSGGDPGNFDFIALYSSPPPGILNGPGANFDAWFTRLGPAEFLDKTGSEYWAAYVTQEKSTDDIPTRRILHVVGPIGCDRIVIPLVGFVGCR